MGGSRGSAVSLDQLSLPSAHLGAEGCKQQQGPDSSRVEETLCFSDDRRVPWHFVDRVSVGVKGGTFKASAAGGVRRETLGLSSQSGRETALRMFSSPHPPRNGEERPGDPLSVPGKKLRATRSSLDNDIILCISRELAGERETPPRPEVELTFSGFRQHPCL